MKITMYELLGMIKNSKFPKMFKYDEYEWELNCSEYVNNKGTEFMEYMGVAMYSSLNDEVEIIEDEKPIEENNKIEKLNKMHFHKRQRQLANKINELIDVINEQIGGNE